MTEPHQDRHGTLDHSTADALIASRCRQLLDESGADGVSVSVRTGGVIGDLLHATDGVSAALEELQAVLGVGPAHDAYRTGAVIDVPDLNGTDALGRWPGFAHEAAATTAVALLAVPLMVHGEIFGHVEFYAKGPRSISLTSCAAGVIELLKDAVLALFSNERGAAQAWEPDAAGRPDLHIAAGIVSVQLGVSLADAMARMCATAFGEQRTLQRVAHDIVSGVEHRSSGDPAG